MSSASYPIRYNDSYFIISYHIVQVVDTIRKIKDILDVIYTSCSTMSLQVHQEAFPCSPIKR